MSTTTTAVQTGTLPRVNLLPQEISESAKFRTAQLVMGLAVVGAVVVVGGLWYLASSDESAAQDQLATAQSDGAPAADPAGHVRERAAGLRPGASPRRPS